MACLLSVCLSVRVCICLSVHLFVCLCVSLCLFSYPLLTSSGKKASVYGLSAVCLPVCFCLSFRPSVCLIFLCLSPLRFKLFSGCRFVCMACLLSPVFLSVCFFYFFILSVSLVTSICLCLCLSVCVTVSSPVFGDFLNGNVLNLVCPISFSCICSYLVLLSVCVIWLFSSYLFPVSVDEEEAEDSVEVCSFLQSVCPDNVNGWGVKYEPPDLGW